MFSQVFQTKGCFGTQKRKFEKTIILLFNKYKFYWHFVPCPKDKPKKLLKIQQKIFFYLVQLSIFLRPRFNTASIIQTFMQKIKTSWSKTWHKESDWH
jgi:hypothetical protein